MTGGQVLIKPMFHSLPEQKATANNDDGKSSLYADYS